MSSIQEFKSNLLGGGARPNQYRVDLTFPAIAQNGTEAGRRAQFLCSSTSLPGSVIGVAPVFFRGRQLKLAGERQFAPWAVTIINDTDFLIRNSFESWANSINTLDTNTGITSPLIYTADMTVNQLDRNGAVLKSYKFVGAWPSQISEIEVSFAENDRVEEFMVTFEYTHYETSFSTAAISVGINI